MVWVLFYDYEDPVILVDYSNNEGERCIVHRCIVHVRGMGASIIIPEREENIFSFYGIREGRNYYLTLDLEGGLIERVDSTRTHEIEEHLELIEHMDRKRIGEGSFDDFRAVADYAIERLPFIASDLLEPPLVELPDSSPDEIEGVHKNLQKDMNWKDFQYEVGGIFYRCFCDGLQSSGKIDSSQSDKLRGLVSCLDN
ncbi:MAG: hypothetical protein IIA87_01985 [Nanoarchaeota archaeon]|nr:hypothetical protein [Nanoarchaeota archaeon]